MNIATLMSPEVRTCRPNDSLEVAANIMWKSQCDQVLVVDAKGKVIATVSDRDICMTALLHKQPLANLRVSSAASDRFVTVRESDGSRLAETLMREHGLRRLPVVDTVGVPIGVLSLDAIESRTHCGGACHGHGSAWERGLIPTGILRTLLNDCH